MAKLTDLKALIDAKRAAEPKAPEPKRARSNTMPPSGANASTPPNLSPRRAIAAAKHAEGDVDLKAAFADVAPMKPANRVRHAPSPPSPVPRQRVADELDALEASKFGAEPAPQTWDIGQEIEAEQTFLRSGLGTDVLAKLRRGQWTVQAELDLHGHDSEEAHDALADFLDEARGAGMRCVRVIHGKGLTSPNREPVLKGKVRRWLMRWDEVLAYCEAPRHAGGGGAVIVLLRGR